MLSPFAQTDPASLAIWLNASPRANDELNVRICSALDAALAHDSGVLRNSVSNTDDATAELLANAVTAVWHEKRHVLDLLLSNYGAFRRRQFISVQTNLFGLLAQARRAGLEQVWFPLTTYSDPTAPLRFDLGPTVPALVQQSNDIRGREALLSQDAWIGKGPYGAIAAGGDAQLEAIAFLCEGSAFRHEFGAENWARQYGTDPQSRTGRLYGWFAPLFDAFGLGAKSFPYRGAKGLFVDATLVIPVLFAALSGRFWGDRSAGVMGMMPLPRLHALLQDLATNTRLDDASDVPRVWAIVNDASKRIWGRTVLEELAVDIERDGAWLEQVAKETDCSPWLYEQLDTLLRRRTDLFRLLVEEPELVLDAREYHSRLAPRLAPRVVRSWARGYIGVAPPGWRPLWQRAGSYPQFALCWANHRIASARGDALQLSSSCEQWERLARFEAPLSKLALKGRRHRMMLPLELEGVESAVPMRVAIDPLFYAPEPEHNAAELFHAIGIVEQPCDRCRTIVGAEGATVAPAWWIRSQSSVHTWLNVYCSSDAVDALMLADWSEWILCASCLESLEET